jgi:1-acyl-sn-glycerol-3-phosphate acyltransferase
MAPDLVEMKAQVYKDPRPKSYFDRFHKRTRTREPDAVYELVRMATALYSWIFFRARCIGSDHVPAAGPVILAPNHFSFMDHFFLAIFLRRKVRFMAKSQMFKKPLQFIYTHGGVFPVRRGHADEEAFVTAETVLERGGTVAMYCEGGRSRTGDLSREVKPGIGRLAARTGAPVVPVAIYGSQRVRNWRRFDFPKVTVHYGEPVLYERVEDPSREHQQAVADDIFTQIRGLYAELEAHGRKSIRQRVRAKRRAAARATRPVTG